MSEREEIVEIYKIHVEMIDRISQRRGATNHLYITLLTGLFSIIAFAKNPNNEQFSKLVFIAIGLLGITLTILWLISIQSYKQLNSAKFRVVEMLENKLSFQFYKEEWLILKASKKYNNLTRTEKFMPIILTVLFFVLLLYGFFS